MGLIKKLFCAEKDEELYAKLEELWNTALAPKLEELVSIKKDSQTHNVGINEQELESERVRILREFYERNQLAYEVSQGKNSYGELIKPIEERYDGFRKLVSIPRLDPSFDSYAENILSSMINVGLKEAVFFTPNIFSISERRKEVKSCRNMSACAGILIPLTCAGGFIKCYDDMTAIESIYIGITALVSFSLIYALSFFGRDPYHLGPPTVFRIKNKLESLHLLAEETDEYLRQEENRI